MPAALAASIPNIKNSGFLIYIPIHKIRKTHFGIVVLEFVTPVQSGR